MEKGGKGKFLLGHKVFGIKILLRFFNHKEGQYVKETYNIISGYGRKEN